MTIKIIHILHHSPYWTSRKEEVEDILDGWHVRTAKAIQKLNINSCNIECWLPNKKQSKIISFEKDNITYRIFPSFAFSYGREFSPLMINVLKSENRNKILIHLHGIFNYLTYYIAYRFADKPIIAQHHGDCPSLYLLARRKLLYCISPFLISEYFLNSHTLRNIDYFFCLTKYSQNILHKLGIKNKSCVQTMGVDFNKFYPPINKTEVKKQLNIQKDKKVILYVGQLNQYKGSNKVIEAFNQLKKKYMIECLMVGVNESDRYYSYAKNNDVKLYNRQPHQSLIKFYQAADVLVFPASDNFIKWGGLGVNVMESLACNVPVVSATLIHF
ncbi:MAG: glycosyltransferase family 4 protein, partial [candidate division WOR-3 bacterium]